MSEPVEELGRDPRRLVADAALAKEEERVASSKP
jgi:hypothetical protein